MLEKYNENFEKFFFENDKYTVIMPKNVMDFIQEGEALNNCLGWNNYVDKVIANYNTILFVRKKENVNKPYVAMDIVKNRFGTYQINQYYGHNNSYPAGDTFKEEYAQFLKTVK